MSYAAILKKLPAEFQLPLLELVALTRLADRQDHMSIRLDKLIGRSLEDQYKERPFAYFGPILRRAQTVSWQEIESTLEERLSDNEFEDVALLDVLVRGRPRSQPAGTEIFMALEVSATIDRNDVQRALRRSSLLTKAGYSVVPAVAGEETTQGAVEAARASRVVVVQNGTILFWQEALAQVLDQ